MSVGHSSVLVEEILAGGQQELQLLAAKGLMPLPAETLLDLQVALVSSGSPEVSFAARYSLNEAQPQIVISYLQDNDRPDAVRYFADNSKNQQILATVIGVRSIERQLLATLASRIGPDLQEVLLQRQDAIVELPEILDHLEKNPQLTVYSSRRIVEYRQHLIARAPVAPEPEEPTPELDPEALADLMTEAELEEEIEKVKDLPALGERDENTGLNETQIRAMSMGARLQLTRGAQKTLRNILVKDANPLVAVSIMQNSPMTEGEVEKVAANRTVVVEVLEEIGRRRDWMRKYNIAHNLVRNPRAPIGLAVRLVPRLGVRDLGNLARDRNIPDAVRKAAQRLYKMKTT